MRVIVVALLGAAALSGCSGLSGFSLPKPDGGSVEAREQEYCQNRYGFMGAGAVNNCRYDERKRREATAAAR